MAAYYNEIDPYCAEWLRNLIKEGLIAPGDVDERDIRDVTPAELVSYTQCNFFAGIGGWPYALRLAGWPDDRPVWTGSCPCQSFSAAGRGKGGADERHLWPYWFYLIRVCRPATIFGEQVASKLALSWLDLVFDDLEAEGYSCGAADLCAAGVGAPHIRQRLWFVGIANRSRPQSRSEAAASLGYRRTATSASPTGLMADPLSPRVGGGDQRGLGTERREVGEQKDRAGVADESGDGCEDALPLDDPLHPVSPWGESSRKPKSSKKGETVGFESSSAIHKDGNFWTPCTWLPCRDGKFRPTQSGIFPLAHGIPGRVGQLRAAGNAIIPQVAAEFIKAVMEILYGTATQADR